MLPEAYLVHRLPHRFRIKIPSRKGDDAFFERLEKAFVPIPEIEAVRSNPTTGSLVVHHRLDVAKLTVLSEKHQLFHLAVEAPQEPVMLRRVARRFQGLNSTVKEATDGELDLPSVAFLFLFCAGIYEISRGNFMLPAWYTAFWYAMGIVQGANKSRSSQGSDTEL